MTANTIIAELMKNRNLSQCELASLLNINQSMVSQWITGRKSVSIPAALEIEQKFGIQAELINTEIREIIEKLNLKRAA